VLPATVTGSTEVDAGRIRHLAELAMHWFEAIVPPAARMAGDAIISHRNLAEFDLDVPLSR
jgi:hypothetical protein